MNISIIKGESAHIGSIESILLGFLMLWESLKGAKAYVFKGFSAHSGIKSPRFDILFSKVINNKSNMGFEIKIIAAKFASKQISLANSIVNQYVNDLYELVAFCLFLHHPQKYAYNDCKRNVRNAVI